MAAATKITQEQIDELIRKGKANKGVLTYGDVMNLTNTLEDITPEDVEHIYEVITRKGLELVDDDNASDEDILPLVGNDEDNDEPSSSELENMSVPEGISIDEQKAAVFKNIPIGRIPTDDECAKAALFLISDMAAVVTGVCLDVNGGEFIAP